MITKQTTIGEVVEKYPLAAVAMQNAGLNCAGCGVAYWETIEEGARGHGFDEKMIDELMREVNRIAAESSEEHKTEHLIISKRAI